ncbi:MAG: adenylate/guanylate cyclase domain-containing response regulator [Anaerolineae bacterium]|nr:adenylate/guanylate cyclase domain-containing response regulator [Anaerolineae bacterium]
MKVLIAEDNVDSRELLNEILETLGVEVVVAIDGVFALEKARQEMPDLMILDVDMPRKNGFEVVEILKSDPLTASIPVIMLTAQSDVESRVKGLGLGADDYLTKPFNPRELIARVNTRMRAKAETDDLREQRKIIERTFSRYVAREIIEVMLADPTRVALGGQMRPVTVLFADLEGFTSLSEFQDPTVVLNILNRYHGLMVSFIKSNGGTVDKFLGDGLMALFNAPIDQPDHVYFAVKAATEMRDALDTFHEHESPNLRLGINFGINTGLALVGNVGAEDLMDYTAVGDTVNLAARLQSLSKNSQITISEAVYRALEGRLEADWVGPVQVKGREEPVVIYHVNRLR